MVWPRTVVGVYTLYSHNGKRRVCENSEASTRWHHGYFYPTTASFSHHNWRTGWMHYRVTSFELFLQLSYVIVFMPPPENDWLTEALCSHATCPFSVFCSFLSFVYIRYFENDWTDFDANSHKWSTGQWHETINFGGHDVKDQGHTRLNIDLDWRPGGGIILDSSRSSSFSSFLVFLKFSLHSMFIVVYGYAHLSEQGFLPGCPVWHICILYQQDWLIDFSYSDAKN